MGRFILDSGYGRDFSFDREIMFQLPETDCVCCVLLWHKRKRCDGIMPAVYLHGQAYVVELSSSNPHGIFSYGTFGRHIGVLQSRADPSERLYRLQERKLNADGEIIMGIFCHGPSRVVICHS